MRAPLLNILLKDGFFSGFVQTVERQAACRAPHRGGITLSASFCSKCGRRHSHKALPRTGRKQMLRHTAGRLTCSAVCSSMPPLCRACVIKGSGGGRPWRSRPLLGPGQLTSCQPWASILLCCAASQLQNALQHFGRRPTYTASLTVYLVGPDVRLHARSTGPVKLCCHRLSKA